MDLLNYSTHFFLNEIKKQNKVEYRKIPSSQEMYLRLDDTICDNKLILNTLGNKGRILFFLCIFLCLFIVKEYKYISIYAHFSLLKGEVMGWVIQIQQSRPSMAQRMLLKNNRGQLKQWIGKKEIKSLAVKFWHPLIMVRLLYNNVAAFGNVTNDSSFRRFSTFQQNKGLLILWISLDHTSYLDLYWV